jgi:hypothetical protein
MMNMIPGKYHGKLALPFMLMHGICPDQRTWLPLFTLCYFHHEKGSDALRSKSQAHTMDGILIGHSPTSNAILVYNPRNQKYYEPNSYRLNPYRLPSLVYPTINNNGGLFVSLHRDETAVISKPYPLGTRVEEFNQSSKTTQAGTVMDIPINPLSSPQYLIMFDDGTTRSVSFADMPALISKPTTTPSDATHLLPPFLEVRSKMMFKHEGQLHKGFLSKSPDSVY